MRKPKIIPICSPNGKTNKDWIVNAAFSLLAMFLGGMLAFVTISFVMFLINLFLVIL
jgi:hypothetical protein